VASDRVRSADDRPAGADDDSYEASIDGALEFAECAGLYYASADLGPEFGQSPGDVDLARGLGNGAALAAQYLLAHVRVVSQPLDPGALIPPNVWKMACRNQAATLAIRWPATEFIGGRGCGVRATRKPQNRSKSVADSTRYKRRSYATCGRTL
jgi:hypothetical protein